MWPAADASERTANGRRTNATGQFDIADTHIALRQFRLQVLHCAWLADKEQAGEVRPEDLREAISSLKVATANISKDVVWRAMHLHGALANDEVLRLMAESDAKANEAQAKFYQAQIDKAILDALLRAYGRDVFGGLKDNIAGLDARLIERWLPDDQRPEILDRELRWLPEQLISAKGSDLAVSTRVGPDSRSVVIVSRDAAAASDSTWSQTAAVPPSARMRNGATGSSCCTSARCKHSRSRRSAGRTILPRGWPIRRTRRRRALACLSPI